MILTADQITSSLPTDWEFVAEDNHVSTTIEFADFSTAVDFINALADIADDLNHHPDVLLFDEKYVQVILTTKSENGVTQNDIDFANQVNEVLSEAE